MKFNIRNVLALIVVLSITGIIILGHFVVIPPENKDLISGAINQYIAVGFAVVIAFFFVASKDTIESKKHVQEMEKLALAPEITEDMKTHLGLLGYTDEDIEKLSFKDAIAIIVANKAK